MSSTSITDFGDNQLYLRVSTIPSWEVTLTDNITIHKMTIAYQQLSNGDLFSSPSLLHCARQCLNSTCNAFAFDNLTYGWGSKRHIFNGCQNHHYSYILDNPYQVHSDELIQPVGERLKWCQLAGIDHGGHLLGDRLIVNGFSSVFEFPSLKSFVGS